MLCPKLNRRYKVSFCVSMIMRERCPVVKCDFFSHREKHKVYRIVRKEKRRDVLLDRLDSIERQLEELGQKL